MKSFELLNVAPYATLCVENSTGAVCIVNLDVPNIIPLLDSFLIRQRTLLLSRVGL